MTRIIEETLGVYSFLLIWLSVMANQPIFIPQEVQNIMAGVTNMESFMRAMNLGNLTIKTLDTSFQSTSNRRPKGQSPFAVFLARSHVKSLGVPVALENIMCNGQPQVMAVPQPEHSNGFYFPTHVKLHRCAGACTTKPRVLQCTPTETRSLDVLVVNVGWSHNPKTGKLQLHRTPRLIQMLNHTKCGCQCITRPTECNPTSQIWVEENCRCECKPRHTPCPRHYQWDRIQCKCICNPYRIPDCPRRYEWYKDECRCGCKKIKCKYNKIRRPSNCRCECPRLPSCASGLKRDRRSCKCKPRHKW